MCQGGDYLCILYICIHILYTHIDALRRNEIDLFSVYRGGFIHNLFLLSFHARESIFYTRLQLQCMQYSINSIYIVIIYLS